MVVEVSVTQFELKRMNINWMILLLILASFRVASQQSIGFESVFGSDKILLNHRVQLSDSSWMRFSVLRFYVSHFKVFSKGNVWENPKSVQLIDVFDLNKNFIDIPYSAFDSIQFNLGTDSVSNVSQEYEGDLDPVNGMYWAWNTGYINFKLEGNSSNSTSEDGSFEFHLGGYLTPYQSMQHIELNANNTGLNTIQFDVQLFLKQINLQQVHHVLQPGVEAIQLAKILPYSFKLIRDEK